MRFASLRHDPCMDLTRVDKMKCDQCNKEATVFLTDFINGEVSKVSLCEQCALERSSGEESAGLDLSDLLWGLGNPDQKVSLEEEREEQELLCPHCGFAERDFDKSERLGCPQCYGVYAERLSGMWKNFQHGTVHTGKRPHNAEALAAVPASPVVPSGAEAEKPAKATPASAPEADAPRVASVQHRIAELQAQMAEALREEAYEHAATLRDLIRDQEKQIRDFEGGRSRSPQESEAVASSAPSGSAGESA